MRKTVNWQPALWFALTAITCSAPRATAQEENPGKVTQQKPAKNLLETARKVYELQLGRERLGDVRGSAVSDEDVNRWSRRWLDAQLNLADSTEKRIAAYNEHLERMRERESRAKKLFKAGESTPEQLATSEYFRIQAELWLERAKAQPAGK
jgi:hypothetical protein